MAIPYEELPEHLRSGTKLWIEESVIPGGFLQAVIRNDLKDAVFQADSESLKALPEIVRWWYHNAPGGCWMTREKADRWAKRRR